MNRILIKIKSILFKISKSDHTYVTSAQIYSKAVSFIVFLYISHDLTISEYANFVLIFAIFTAVADVGNSGLLHGILRNASEYRNQPSSQPSITCTSLINACIVALILIVIISFLGKFISEFIYSNKIILIFYFFVFFITIFSVFNTLFNAFGKFKLYLLSTVVNSTMLAVLVVLFGIFYEPSVEKILIYYLASVVCAVFVQTLIESRRIIGIYNVKFASKTLKFGSWYLLWALLSTFENKIDIFFLAKITNKSELAIYDVSTKFLQLIQLLFTSSSLVLTPLMVAAQDDKLKLEIARGKINIAIKILIYINLLLVLPVSLFIKIYYNGRYDVSILCYSILAMGMVFLIMTLRYSIEIYKKNKPHYFIIVGICSLAVKLLFMFALIDELGAVGVSFSVMVSCAFSLLVYKQIVRFIR